MLLLLLGHTNIVSERLQDFEVVVGDDADAVSLDLLMVFIPKNVEQRRDTLLLQFVRGSQRMPVYIYDIAAIDLCIFISTHEAYGVVVIC